MSFSEVEDDEQCPNLSLFELGLTLSCFGRSLLTDRSPLDQTMCFGHFEV